MFLEVLVECWRDSDGGVCKIGGSDEVIFMFDVFDFLLEEV